MAPVNVMTSDPHVHGASHDVVVDVHTHVFPPGLPDVAARTGDDRWPSLAVAADGRSARIMRGNNVFRPVDARCFDLGARLVDMDASGVDVQVLSPVPITLCSWAEPSVSSVFAQAQNQAIADAIAASADPGRFRWMGGVTLQDPRCAVADLEHGLALGMTGVEIGTTVDTDTGVLELDHPSLHSFWDAVQQLGVAVFVHPTTAEGAIRRGGQPYEFALGMLTDTATAASALVFGGVLEQFPDVRIGLAHGCGTFPWAMPRLARGATLPGGPFAEVPSSGAEADVRADVRGDQRGEVRRDVQARTAELVRRLWADTLVFDPAHLPLLIERFGADHLMLGSDTPFYPADWGNPVAMLADAAASGTCTSTQCRAMLGTNAIAFLTGV